MARAATLDRDLAAISPGERGPPPGTPPDGGGPPDAAGNASRCERYDVPGRGRGGGSGSRGGNPPGIGMHQQSDPTNQIAPLQDATQTDFPAGIVPEFWYQLRHGISVLFGSGVAVVASGVAR